jgi:hypothetical protein
MLTFEGQTCSHFRAFTINAFSVHAVTHNSVWHPFDAVSRLVTMILQREIEGGRPVDY